MQRQANKGGGGGRVVKQQGWEEAGNEFYQEAFHNNSDERKRDSKIEASYIQTQITTDLPSKQYRTIDARTWGRTQGRTARRRMSTRRRRSSLGDVELESLPDLTDEGLADEEETWNRIQEIRSLPVDMTTKRELRAQLLHAPTFRLKGLAALQMKRRKLCKNAWERFADIKETCLPWQCSIRQIEANYGAGIASFFTLIRWLLVLNLAMTFLIIIFVVIPWEVGKTTCTSEPSESYVHLTPSGEEASNFTLLDYNSGPSNDIIEDSSYFTYEKFRALMQLWTTAPDYTLGSCSTNQSRATENCWQNYTLAVEDVVKSHSGSPLVLVQDFVQGTGWMQLTLGFYGYFPPAKLYPIANKPYDISLAYLAAVLVGLLLSVICMTRSAATGFRLKLRAGELWRQRYSNILFTSWDFCINNRKAADLKRKAIFQEIRAQLASDRTAAEKANRTRRENVRLYCLRAAINVLIALILALCGAALYYIVRESLAADRLVAQYAPSVVITTLNFFIPKLFSFLTSYESYSPGFEIRVKLFRTVFLRLASVVVLMSTMYVNVVSKSQEGSCSATSFGQGCEDLKLNETCWETLVGQQLYKLCLFDFIVIVAMVFLVDWPVKLVTGLWAVRKPTSYVARWDLHNQEFDLASHTLDIVYSQTLCWLGVFYCPVLPLMTALKCVVTFYAKRFTCVHNCVPPTRLYQASRSSAFFMNILLLSFIGCAVPVGYAIFNISPSKECGPFRGLCTVWDSVTQIVNSADEPFESVLRFFGTAGFFIPALLVLLLSLYYFICLSHAHRELVLSLRSQLELEGKDKQFLLTKLAALSKLDQSRKHMSPRPEL